MKSGSKTINTITQEAEGKKRIETKWISRKSSGLFYGEYFLIRRPWRFIRIDASTQL